jgi:branched-chain amino acid transport system substrate-binding protein
MQSKLFHKLAAGAGAIALSALSLGTTAATASASSERTFTIAYEGPLSGGNAQLGLNMKYAVQLAVNQANAGTTFGHLPFKLAFTSSDDQGSATQSPGSAQQLIGTSSVMAVVGPAFSGATAAAEPLYAQAGLATVSPSATLPSLAQHHWRTFFRVVADDNAQGPADAQYASKVLKAKAVYSLDDGSAYGGGLVAAFDKAAQGLHIKVRHSTALGTTQCQAGTGNVQQYSAVATTVKSSKAPVVFYGGYYCDFALLAKALRSAGYRGTLMSDDGSLDPHYISDAGARVANGTVISCACADLSKSAAAAPFAKQFKRLAHFAVGTYSAEAYDATNTIISVMKKLGVKKISRSAVTSALHGVRYKGLTKVVRFQGDGNIAGASVYIYQVVRGKIVSKGLAP